MSWVVSWQVNWLKHEFRSESKDWLTSCHTRVFLFKTELHQSVGGSLSYVNLYSNYLLSKVVNQLP